MTKPQSTQTPAPQAQPAAPPQGKKSPKPRSRYTRETYDRILAGYRGAPGNHTQAALYAQCDKAMARRAFHQGFPRQYKAGATWARPIKEVLAEEVEAARVRKAELNRREREAQDAERERARAEHVEELAEEGRLRGALRKDLLGAALTLSELIPSLRLLVGVVKSAVLEPDGKTPKATPSVTPIQAMKLLQQNALAVGRLATAGEQIVQLGRTVRGQTNLNVGLVDMSPEEALEELEMAREVLEQTKAAREAEAGEPEPGAQGGEAGPED